MSLPCAVPNEDPQDGAAGPTDDASAATEFQEIAATDALIALVQALDRQPTDGRPVVVAASTLSQLSMLLLDYRRALESMGAQVMALPTLRERESALTAYQGVRRRITALLRTLNDALGERRQ